MHGKLADPNLRYFFGIVPPDALSQTLRATFRYGTEPHITVKAQSGLTHANVEEWTAAVRREVGGFGSVEVALGEMGTFGEHVAYLSVQSDKLGALHDLLVETIAPPHEERLRYHELGPFVPHLTIGRGKHIDFDELRERTSAVLPLPPFTVDSIWLFRQDAAGMPYTRVDEISLATRH